MGGTFDPIHIGHLIMAEQAWEQFGLNKVLFVTAADPPHKAGMDLTDALDRHEMVRLAVEGNDHFEASTLELDRGGTSYTIDTVREIYDLYNEQVEVYLLIGMDEAAAFMSWREPHEIAKLATIAVAVRESSKISKCELANILPGDIYEKIVIIDMPIVDISSTDIRERIKNGKSIRYRIPQSVEKFITDRGIYR